MVKLPKFIQDQIQESIKKSKIEFAKFNNPVKKCRGTMIPSKTKCPIEPKNSNFNRKQSTPMILGKEQ